MALFLAQDDKDMYTSPPNSSSFNWMNAFSFFIFFSKVDTEVSYGTHSENLSNRTCSSAKNTDHYELPGKFCKLQPIVSCTYEALLGFTPFERNKIAYFDKIILSLIVHYISFSKSFRNG